MISLSRDEAGTFNIGDLLEQKKEGGSLEINGLRIKKGRLRFLDLAAGSDPVKVALDDMDVSLSHLTRGKKCAFRISADMADSGKKANIHLAGSAKLAEKEKPLSDTAVTATVVVKNLDVERYWAYYSRFVPFKKILGHVDIDSVFKGTLAQFNSKGTVKINGLRFDYPQVFHAVLAPRVLRFTYDLQLDPRDIRVKSIDVDVDGARVKGNCAILDIPSKDIRITARASSSNVRFEDYHELHSLRNNCEGYCRLH